MENGTIDSRDAGISGGQRMLMHMLDMGGMSLTSALSVSSSMTSQDIKPNLSSLSADSSQTGSYFSYGMHLGMTSSQTGSVNSTPLCSSSLVSSQSLMPLESPVSARSQNNPHLSHISLGNKHICAICDDRASGKHYGVYSCEGCKGFFKRTVRKDLTYACRDDRNCMIDKRQRNRCQYCRYMKCLSMGMKREAVQEERQQNKENGEEADESSINANSEMPVEEVLAAEISVDPQTDSYIDVQKCAITNIVQAAEKQLITLVRWAKKVPHFSELHLDDQICLLAASWHELLIAGFSHRSISAKDGFLLSTGLYVHRSSAHNENVGEIFDRVLTELVDRMRDLKMNKTELGCLRAIVLFNPEAKDLKSVQKVEQLREKVYASLEEYCKRRCPDEPGRFAKLLLRLPALRGIGMKCLDQLHFFKKINATPINTFLLEMLEKHT